MTLLEELEQAAKVMDGLASGHRAKGKLDGVVECDLFASQLRARAERLREALASVKDISPAQITPYEFDHARGMRDALEAIDAPTGTTRGRDE